MDRLSVAFITEDRVNLKVPPDADWTSYVDGASNSEGSGGGIILISPCTLRFEFSASNNKAEYEALIVGLKLALEMKVEYLEAFSDSQIVVYQVNSEYLARGGRLAKYFSYTDELLSKFKKVIVSRIIRAYNSHANALVRLASTREAKLLDVILVDLLAPPIIDRKEVMQIDVMEQTTWMT
uniref:RNase H type-1 domain-containing protein n=1 Tax=Cannabis sativa TaxID=3483 RepID=A0A803QBF8_CANSA